MISIDREIKIQEETIESTENCLRAAGDRLEGLKAKADSLKVEIAEANEDFALAAECDEPAEAQAALDRKGKLQARLQVIRRRLIPATTRSVRRLAASLRIAKTHLNTLLDQQIVEVARGAGVAGSTRSNGRVVASTEAMTHRMDGLAGLRAQMEAEEARRDGKNRGGRGRKRGKRAKKGKKRGAA